MRLIFTLSVVLLSSLICLVKGHTIRIEPRKKECFFESLHTDDKMTVTFVTAPNNEEGNPSIDFWITGPSGVQIVKEGRMENGDYSFTATADGTYRYCFSNEYSHSGIKDVSFNVHGIVYVPATSGDEDPLEKEVRTLGELLQQVKDEQEYIKIRERVHRNTAESTNSRVKWWSIFQTGVLVGVCVFQVSYLKRFFEVKRVV